MSDAAEEIFFLILLITVGIATLITDFPQGCLYNRLNGFHHSANLAVIILLQPELAELGVEDSSQLALLVF